MRGIRVLTALFALFIAACGNGSIKSPDFSSGLESLSLAPLTPAVAEGETVQLTLIGTYSAQPGQPAGTRPIPEANYTVTPSSIASVDAAGLVTGLVEGIATITATVGNQTSNPVTLTVGPAVLQSIVVRTRAPDGSIGETGTATVAAAAQQGFKVLGIYSNSVEPQDLSSDVTVSWESDDTAVATVSPTSGFITTATAVDEGSAQIKATATLGAETFEASGTLNVTTSALVELIRLAPSPALTSIGQSLQFQAIGRFANNSEQAVDNNLLDWSSTDPTIATVGASTGIATGVAIGNVAITATLKPSVITETGAQRSASENLSVGAAACPDPLLAVNGAAVTSDRSPICDLTCLIENEANVIDADLTNYAWIRVALAALGANASISVTSPTTITASVATPHPAGFIVGRPRGQLLSAELLAQRKTKVTTLLNGVEQESFEGPQALRVSLLGLLLGGDSDTALAYVTATKDFNELRFTFGGGVASALTSVRVFSACPNAIPPAP